MNLGIVCSSEPVTLVGGGAATIKDVSEALALAPGLVAADGGAALALRAGKIPQAVIGDMDSLDPDTMAQLPRGSIHRISEQDSTDFDKAVRSIDAPVILGVGFTGARLDHQLAALNVLAARPEKCVILIAESELIFHVPRRILLPCAPGDVVSLMPLGDVTGRSVGLKWPLDGLQFAPTGRIGTSNEAIGRVQLEMDGPGMIGIIPRARLAPVVETLAALPHEARWPARA